MAHLEKYAQNRNVQMDECSQINTQIKKKKKCGTLHQVVCYLYPGAMLTLYDSSLSLCAPEMNT